MLPDTFNVYKGEGNRSVPKFEPNKRINSANNYKPSEGLMDAVNVALALGQPLLLTGEPGTGKTQLAFHLAHYFGQDKPLVFNTKTTSVATDLFYFYDSIRHFQYIQNHDTDLSVEAIEERFITYRALGEAIKSTSREIVLIDEIDKAPRDLPNDILNVLEKLEFEVPEINRVGTNAFRATPDNRPIIIMTSNSEKNLPDPFLRRCIYYHLDFPDPSTLRHILATKILGLNVGEQDLIVNHFNDVRGLLKQKKPATAELLYWANVLKKLEFPIGKLQDLNRLEQDDKRKLLASYSVLAKNEDDLKTLAKRFS